MCYITNNVSRYQLFSTDFQFAEISANTCSLNAFEHVFPSTHLAANTCSPVFPSTHLRRRGAGGREDPAVPQESLGRETKRSGGMTAGLVAGCGSLSLSWRSSRPHRWWSSRSSRAALRWCTTPPSTAGRVAGRRRSNCARTRRRTLAGLRGGGREGQGKDGERR